MITLFLTTVLSCQQVLSIANRLMSVTSLTAQQKKEILSEISKTVTSCPLIIKMNDKNVK
jgi:hypothetical protein